MSVNDINTIILNFHGPYKFLKGANYLFDSEFVKNEGIYIWAIKDELNNINYLSYIGETKSLGKRQKEHILGITSLNYRIIDAESAKKGIEKILWNGMWRDRSSAAVANLLENYNGVNQKVVENIGLYNIYFAPTNLEASLRKHLEGCIGWNLRKKYPEFSKFYPKDNHIGTKSKLLGMKLIVNLPEEIAGVEREYIV